MRKQFFYWLIVAAIVVMAGCSAKTGPKTYQFPSDQGKMDGNNSSNITLPNDTKLTPLEGMVDAKSYPGGGLSGVKPDEIIVFGGPNDPDINMTIIDINQSGVKSIYFAYDSYVIEPAMQSVLKKNSELIRGLFLHGARLRLEGNCDKRGSDEYNYALGLKRATATKEFLVMQGIRDDLISLISYGESNPECKEEHEACYAKNRRVDFKLEK
ncbi:MAG: OmpA family protein [Campylobacterales bacterium]